ncbi:hypothetical protein ACFSC6_02790 [Rufibacter sediminis]|uniref:PepSY domain-containing protein n=1 Tax=Rufibacter sediminis TaxID=2762756 RepID=A0ABR6VT17_9BACT|nr:hypothetical protein [Rufibacter sediminis]MBC3540312.1 hypothetical protein [Rufibacter sediminis]
MKKVILSAFGLFVFATVSANAQTQTAQTAQTTTAAAQDSKTPVKVEELPEAVKTSITSDAALKEWTPTTVFLVKDAAGKEYYSIEMKKGEEKGVIKLDKEGKQVK